MTRKVTLRSSKKKERNVLPRVPRVQATDAMRVVEDLLDETRRSLEQANLVSVERDWGSRTFMLRLLGSRVLARIASGASAEALFTYRQLEDQWRASNFRGKDESDPTATFSKWSAKLERRLEDGEVVHGISGSAVGDIEARLKIERPGVVDDGTGVAGFSIQVFSSGREATISGSAAPLEVNSYWYLVVDVEPLSRRLTQIEALLKRVDRNRRPELRKRLEAMSDEELDRFERDIVEVHRRRPHWAWLILIALATPVGAWYGWRYIHTLYVTNPIVEFVKEEPEIKPDGRLAFKESLIETSRLQDPLTGEAFQLEAGRNGRLRAVYENALVSVGRSGVDLPAFVNRYRGANDRLWVIPAREVAKLSALDPDKRSISRWAVYVMILPADAEAFLDEYDRGNASCTFTFSGTGVGETVFEPTVAIAHEPKFTIRALYAVHEYPSAAAAYRVGVELRRADGQLQTYWQTIAFDDDGELSMVVEPVSITPYYSNDPSLLPVSVDFGRQCCYANESVEVKLEPFFDTLRSLEPRQPLESYNYSVLWDEAPTLALRLQTPGPVELRIRATADGRHGLKYESSSYSMPTGLHRFRIVAASSNAKVRYETVPVTVDVRPARMR